MLPNKSVVFSKIPTAVPIAGEHLIIRDGEFDFDQQLSPRAFIAKVMHASLEPALRFQLVSPDSPREFPPLPVGQVIVNACILRVLRTGEDCQFSVGEYLIGDAPFQEYIFVTPAEVTKFKRVENLFGLDLRLFLGPLGTSGFAAYSAFYELAKPKRGETIFISAASGAVGQIVGQLALREGLTVIGSVGSDAKLKVITQDLGFQKGFNYKTADVLDELRTLAPEGIDIYYDNVGGAQLEAAIYVLKPHGRIVACGYASQYNTTRDKQYGIRNTGLLVMKQITWTGFLAITHVEKYAQEHQERMQSWISKGQLKPVLDVTHGIDNGAVALMKLFKGENIGKSILSL